MPNYAEQYKCEKKNSGQIKTFNKMSTGENSSAKHPESTQQDDPTIDVEAVARAIQWLALQNDTTLNHAIVVTD